VFLIFAALASALAPRAAAGLRIEWESASAHAVDAGVYGRVRLLRDGSLMLVYSRGRDALARVSRDRGRTWEEPVNVATHEGYGNTNCELIELANGWLLYGLNSRPLASHRGQLPYRIRTLLSRDGGRTWGDERVVFTAGTPFGDGCWEPVFLELPSGEVQLYFANESPYRQSNEQEISLCRSLDRGLTWSAPETVSFRAGSRDGMPAPLLLQDGRTIVCAIEDNGLAGEFKPVVVRTSVDDGWRGGPVLADSPRREAALRADEALAPEIYAGAPALVQLPSGETILSYQSSAGRKQHNADFSVPVVCVGNAQARDFVAMALPFPDLPAEASANWNSLTVLDPDTIMLVSSFERVDSPHGRSAIWTIIGRVVWEKPADKVAAGAPEK
jgi:hypothetical protein